DSGFELIGFSDADYAGCKDTFKSTSGGVQFLGEKLVSWSSNKQDCTTLSIAEAEYVSLSACCAQILWMRTQLTGYGFHFNKVPIYYDSKSAIAISCNPVRHSRTKHIAVHCNFIKEHVEKGGDLQLGVKSYQKKLKLTKPDTIRSDLKNRTAFTTYSDPQGVIYKDQNNRNRLMCTDKLHKFSNGTLNSVWTTLRDITSGIRMEYLP
nr:retrovirus-related Pol polyprotein from transposon TNT 1-94 [Tanacetum cinerariifolium]